MQGLSSRGRKNTSQDASDVRTLPSGGNILRQISFFLLEPFFFCFLVCLFVCFPDKNPTNKNASADRQPKSQNH